MNFKYRLTSAIQSISPEGTQGNIKAPTRVSQRVPSAKKIHPEEDRGPWWNHKRIYGLARRVPSTKRAFKVQVPRNGGKNDDKLKENGGYPDSLPENLSKYHQKEGTVAPKGQKPRVGHRLGVATKTQ